MILPRRRLLQASLAAGAASSLLAPRAIGRTTDTVRLTWGYGGLTLIAKERGVFAEALAKQGIKVEWLGPFPNHAPTLQAVTGGSADFSFGGSTTPALAALIAGAPLVFAQFIVYDPRTTAIIAKDGSGIDKVEDLVGKSVAVNRSGLGEFLLVAALEKHGIDRAKVRFIYLNPPDAGPALAAGKVDAWAMWSPGVDIARLQYGAHNVFLEGRDLDFQIDYTSYLVTRAFARDNPDLVRAVIAGLAQEATWSNEHAAEAELMLQKAARYDDAIRDEFVRLHRRYTFYPPGDAGFVKQLQSAADWLAKRKVLPEQITVSDYLATV